MSNRLIREGTWDQLKLHPTTLVRMVIEGEAEVIGKDKWGRKVYRIIRGGDDASSQGH